MAKRETAEQKAKRLRREFLANMRACCFGTTRGMQFALDRLLRAEREAFAELFAEYHRTEGCSCCSDYDGHREAANAIGKYLRAPKYSDGSGYDLAAILNRRPR